MGRSGATRDHAEGSRPCELLPPNAGSATAPIIIPGKSGDDTIFSKVQIVHRLINNFLDLFPVAAPLYELVNVLAYALCKSCCLVEL
jgi:hypothetical protein